jgi:hypothetical protein
MRSLCLAQHIDERWPSADIRFVVSEQAPYAQRVPFRTYFTPSSPTLHVHEVNQILREFRPDVAVFDCSGRVAQLRCAKSLSCRTVFISHHDRKRSLGFRVRRMPFIDEHWIIHPNPVAAELTVLERVKLRLFDGPQVTFVGPVFAPPRQGPLSSPPDPYFLASAGGGGNIVNGKSSGEIFANAAREIAQRTGMHGVVVLGPTFAGLAPVADNLTVIPFVDNAELSWLLQHSDFSIVGGGSLLQQALALGVPVVAVPLTSDQSTRVKAFAELRLCLQANIGSMTRIASDRLAHQDLRAELRDRTLGHNIAPGLDMAITRFANFMPAAGPGE